MHAEAILQHLAEIGDATVAGIADDIARGASVLTVQLRVSRLYEALNAAHKRMPPEDAAVRRIAAAASQCRQAATRTCEPALMRAGIRAALAMLQREDAAAGPAHAGLRVIRGCMAKSPFETRPCAPALNGGQFLIAAGATPGCSSRRQRRSRATEGHTRTRRLQRR
jgi:hypothetical protein